MASSKQPTPPPIDEDEDELPHNKGNMTTLGRKTHVIDWADAERRRITHGFDKPRDNCRTEVTQLNFAINLRKKRESRGWTQTKLAKKLNISVSGISRYESGLIEPGVGAYKRICQAFGMSAGDLLK